eukprot:364791-Chlamydomonas_euryale.AAC.9
MPAPQALVADRIVVEKTVRASRAAGGGSGIAEDVTARVGPASRDPPRPPTACLLGGGPPWRRGGQSCSHSRSTQRRPGEFRIDLCAVNFGAGHPKASAAEGHHFGAAPSLLGPGTAPNS